MEGIPLTEPVPVDDTLCTALGLIEDVEEVGARLVFYAAQTSYEANTEILAVKVKIVVSLSSLTRMVKLILGHLARRGLRGRPKLSTVE